MPRHVKNLLLTTEPAPPIDGTNPYYSVESPEFKGISEAVTVAMAILSKPKGRQALKELADICIAGWAQGGSYRFAGQPEFMDNYIDVFLENLYDYFPIVALAELDPCVEVAAVQTLETPMWDGTHGDFRPGGAVKIMLCKNDCSHMADAAVIAARDSPAAARMYARYQTHILKLVVAIIHALSRVFVEYLSLDPNAVLPILDVWMETEIFGGAIVFLADRMATFEEIFGEVGVPHLVDMDGLCWQVEARCLFELLSNTDEFDSFPFDVRGPGYTPEERDELFRVL